MDCAICLETINDKQTGLLSNSYTSPCCSQNIHKKCLIKWLIDNNTCPLCREKLKLINSGGYIKCTEARFRMLLLVYGITLLIFILFVDNKNIILYFAVIGILIILLLLIINLIKKITNTTKIVHIPSTIP